MVALCAIFMLETKSPSQRTFRFKRPLRRISFLEKSFLKDLRPLKRSEVLPGGLLKWPPSSQKGFDLPRGLLEDQGPPNPGFRYYRDAPPAPFISMF